MKTKEDMSRRPPIREFENASQSVSRSVDSLIGSRWERARRRYHLPNTVVSRSAWLWEGEKKEKTWKWTMHPTAMMKLFARSCEVTAHITAPTLL